MTSVHLSECCASDQQQQHHVHVELKRTHTSEWTNLLSSSHSTLAGFLKRKHLGNNWSKFFYWLDAPPVVHSTMSKHWRERKAPMSTSQHQSLYHVLHWSTDFTGKTALHTTTTVVGNCIPAETEFHITFSTSDKKCKISQITRELCHNYLKISSQLPQTMTKWHIAWQLSSLIQPDRQILQTFILPK